MEIINSNAVKLRSHLDKYLVADADRATVRQSRNAATRRSIWLVEPSNTAAVRFRNCDTGLYLAASDAPFLLGMTGKRVVQAAASESGGKFVFDWVPVRDGFQIKLRTAKGDAKFLRANGGTPPWRNSVTHDVPVSGATSNWTLWDLEAVEAPATAEEEGRGRSRSGVLSPASSIPGSEMSMEDVASPRLLMIKKSGMDFFANAKAVHLRSHHDKYLTADDDEDSVTQDRNGSSRNACWAVEFVPSGAVRLRSCYGKYLTASHHPFLLGMTGCKVLQTLPRRPDSAVEWEPIIDGDYVKLRARNGNFLRANGGLPPWRNSVTHDVPHRSATQDWVLWDVRVVEILKQPATLPAIRAQHVADSDSFSSETGLSSSSERANTCSRQESSDSFAHSPPRLGGGVIYYHIADEDGNVSDDNGQDYPLAFEGNSVKELTHKLEKDTGIEDVVVCTRSPLNGKLYPLRLQLPPNTASIHVVVVPASSAGDLSATSFEALR